MCSPRLDEILLRIKSRTINTEKLKQKDNRSHKDKRFYAGENFRIFPKIFANSAIFSARSKCSQRLQYHQQHIFCMGKQILICGEELRVYDDLLIWLQLIHFAQPLNLGTEIQFKPSKICKALRWHPTGENYKRIYKSICRLSNTRLTLIENKNLSAGVLPVRLIQNVVIVDKVYKVMLGEDLYQLFDKNDFSKLRWLDYLNLTPLAKKIYGYVSSHANPYSLRLATLIKLSGSATKSPIKFKQQIKNAISELVSVNLLKHGIIEKSGDHILVSFIK